MEQIVFGSPNPVLPANDIEKSLAFYGALGFAETFRDGTPASLISVQRAGTELLLQLMDDRAFAENYWLNIPVQCGIEVLYEQLQALDVWTDGAKLGTLEMKPWGRREVHIIDPAGVCVHFYEPQK
jgi:catechol 2,3-dioxygenase-like lactoylglutathione lyase family enzyme